MLGGSADELRLAALGLLALAEKLEVMGRPVPPLLRSMQEQLVTALRCPEVSMSEPARDGVEGARHGPVLLTYEDVAELMSCSLSTVNRLVAAGSLRSVRLGRAARVRRADLEIFLAALAS